MIFELNKEEKEFLESVLEEYLIDLRAEIHRTALHDAKQLLRTKAHVLEEIFRRLTAEGQPENWLRD
jgi:hypothetical protein